MGISFIEASMPFIPTEHLYTIISMCEDDNSEESQRIISICNENITKRENGKLYKVLRKGRDVWVEK